MRKACVAAVLAVALSPLVAAAQEYAIKVKHPGLGDKTRGQVASDFKLEFKVLDNNGNVLMEAQETKAHKLVFQEVGLERAAAGEELVRVQRRYEDAERRVKGERQTLPYQGKTLLIEKKDGAFQFRIKDGEVLEGKDVEELHEEFNKGGLRKLATDHFLPRKAVKLNETWKFDVAPLAKAFSGDGKLEIDDAKSTGTGKLIKAYTKNGKQFGVIALTMEFPVTHMIHEGNKAAAKASKITIQLQHDGSIDGTLDESHLQGTVTGTVRADVTANGMDVTIAIGLHASVDEKRTLTK
jgi:hypothetical protein